jgi:hypothetical protein
LAYHEGHVGYSQQSYNKKAWLLRVAQRVQNTAETYALQLRDCREALELRQEERVTAKETETPLIP